MDEDARARFSGIERLYGQGSVTRLLQRHVAVVGLGGVGSWVAEALARTGVGALTLIDADEVCLSNTNRQLHALDGQFGRNKAEVLSRIATEPLYPAKFAAAFPGETPAPTWGQVIQAIAAFQRTLISGNSKYDQYIQGKAAFTPAETRGLNLFMGEKAECFHCHGSFNFNDQTVHAGSRIVETPFHNTGLYNIGGTGAFPEPNRGVYELTQLVKDMGKFRAPSLRNVEVTGPYMHDGSIATLEEVLQFYAAGGRNITSGPHAGAMRQP